MSIPERFHVEPVSFMDAHSGGAHLMLTVALTFSGVLDEDRVRAASSSLARAWPMLGCRVRRIVPEIPSFELLIPEAEYAAMNTTVSHISKFLHETTSLPHRTSTISTQRLDRNSTLFYPPSLPIHTSAYEYIPDTTPQPGFHLHISILTDATILSLTFPHVLMDASGASTVMRSLLRSINGTDVLPCLEHDPWPSVLASPTEDGEVQLEGWTTYGPAEFALGAKVEQSDLEKDGAISQRTIYFPREEIERLKDQAMRDLKAVGKEVEFVSSGDVIVAWLYKQFYGDEIYDPTRPSRLLYILDARLRLPSHFPPSKVYLRNSYIVAAAPLMENKKVRDVSLGELAGVVRGLAGEGVRKYVKWKWDMAQEEVGRVQVPAGAGERVMWLTFGLGDLSIETIMRPGSGTGKVLDVYCGLPGIPRCSGVITHRDTSGGVVAQFDWAEKNWTSGSVGAYAIERLETIKEKVEVDVESRTEKEKEKEKVEREWGISALVCWIWRMLKI
ncbi:hypothetical protein FRC07_012438 [Ceratobasidium sp. 392]|nr:hypothetical protein FRC07_012438 [Ceratobasidium sp. 392]